MTFSLPYKELAYYNTALGDWVVETGNYKLLIAASSQDIRLSVDFNAEDKIPYTTRQISEAMIG